MQMIVCESRLETSNPHFQLFLALKDVLERDDGLGLSRTSGLVHCAIDSLRHRSVEPKLLGVAERISLTLHLLNMRPRRGDGEVPRLREDLEDLACEWLLNCRVQPAAIS